MGDAAGLGWAGRLMRGREMGCYNLGIRAQTLAEIGQRAADECRIRLPEDCAGGIVFSSGVNDLAILEDGTRRTEFSDAILDFEGLLAELVAIAPVAVVGLGPVDEARCGDR
jgi:acyl-CoA thioesterase-1